MPKTVSTPARSSAALRACEPRNSPGGRIPPGVSPGGRNPHGGWVLDSGMGRPFGYARADREGCRAAESSAGYAYADEHALGALKSVGVANRHARSMPSLRRLG